MDATDAAAGGRQRVVGFTDVLRIPLQRRRTVLAVAAGVLVSVLGYLQFVPETYYATAVVVLRPVVTDPTTPNGGADRSVINMTAENGIAGGNAVVDAVAGAISQRPDDVRDALNIEVPIGGQVLRFEFTNSNEEVAVLGANTAAEAYLKIREDLYREKRDAELSYYDTAIKQVAEQRKTAEKKLPESQDSSPGTQIVLDELRALSDQNAQLANQRAKSASADLRPGSVTAAARTPTPSSHDAALLYLLGAVLGGLLLGILAAHAREAFDRRVRSTEQATDLSGLRALGVVRSTKRGEATTDADARYVALAVMKELDEGSDRPLVVVSSRADEDRTLVAGNLAVALAENGHDVFLGASTDSYDELRRILYSAQRRNPPVPRARRSSHRAVEPPPSNDTYHGAPSWQRTPVGGGPGGGGLTGLTSPAGVLQMPGSGGGVRVDPRADRRGQEPDATVLMAAPKPPAAVGRAGGDAERDGMPLAVHIGAGTVHLGQLSEQPQSGMTVIDAPPSETDERGVRAAQDGLALLVVARDRTRTVDLSRLVDRLGSAGVQTLGFVLTGGRGA